MLSFIENRWPQVIALLPDLIVALTALFAALTAYYRNKAKANEAAIDRMVYTLEDCPDCKQRVKIAGMSLNDKAEDAINRRVQKLTKGG